MTVSQEIQEFLLDNAVERFLKYVKIWTTTDEETGKGIDKADFKKLPEICYTVDGGESSKFKVKSLS
ncbi:unnamed protein product [marine sediment metagenome]|uniref:Uncharacterized protein n=1 Tax=marine sediment metagenome TaxID=412755 RepID=X0ZNV5_9ZZZZ